MIYDRKDKAVCDALDIVRHYDPETYDRMISDPWSVSTDFFEAFPETYDYPGVAESSQRSLGSTQSDRNGIVQLERPRCFLNTRNIRTAAWEEGFPAMGLTASVLVHEFEHAHQPGAARFSNEPPAYRAGSNFCRKLPMPDGAKLAEFSDSTLQGLIEREMKRYAATA